MKTKIKNILLSATMTATLLSVSGCSLDETNPGGFTMDNLATSEENLLRTGQPDFLRHGATPLRN